MKAKVCDQRFQTNGYFYYSVCCFFFATDSLINWNGKPKQSRTWVETPLRFELYKNPLSWKQHTGSACCLQIVWRLC